ncbi:four helix bundle protein [Lewinella sp. JB7]|uniref:four helix bundle protein n=1 Tax=Lewinella sp. JB7 TaxID=2962887 RepID=UPI0020CA026B|nr:four helix bundle protein [Lewinella sp. JB7]MCP9236889.1 four helix bundle protein [Lewinella sp. JB7]
MLTSGFRAWHAYQYAFELAASIFRLTKTFPKDEQYRLSDQICRSSRSVCANLGECFGRRNYPKHFRSKLNDCIAENYETQVWLDLALKAGYISDDHYSAYITASERVGKLLSYMRNTPEQFTSIKTVSRY